MILLLILWKVNVGYESPDWGFDLSICFSSLAPTPGKLRFLSKQSLLQEIIYLDNTFSTNFMPRWRFRQRVPLHNLFPPFRIRILVLDRSPNVERGSGDDMEMILKDRTDPHFTETTNGFCALILTLF